jgi:isopenicillin N synthase-like dioxygenase
LKDVERVKQTIPVVELADYRSSLPERREHFIRSLGDALVTYGFVAVSSHGIDPVLVERAYQCMETLFSLPEDQKSPYEVRHVGRQRGYTPFGKERAKNTSVADLKEFWHVGPEIDPSHPIFQRLPPNVWPEGIPDFKSSTLALWAGLHECATEILAGIAEYLGAPQDTFTHMIQGGNTVLRLIKYPIVDENPDGALWAAEHEDINLITLLVAATDPGLELRTRDGQWLPIHPVPGQLIVDTGDMMQRLTNGLLPATTHRVRAPRTVKTPRYSIPFFVHPHPDVSLTPLRDCLSADESPRWPAETAEQYLENRLRDNGVLTMDTDIDWLAGRTIDDDIE